MLMVEVVAFSMLAIVALAAGGWTMHVVLQQLVQLSMARVARVEASNLDEELRRLNRRDDY